MNAPNKPQANHTIKDLYLLFLSSSDPTESGSRLGALQLKQQNYKAQPQASPDN